MPTEGIIKPKISIKVVGVGGGGGNILSNVRENYDLDMMLISINSDLRQLNTLSKQGITVLPIGERLTQGRGTGGRVEIGEQAARNEERAIRKMLDGTDLVIITATMGGGLGTGAAPVVAEIAHDMGILSIGVVMVLREKDLVSACQTGTGASTCCPETIQSLSWSGPAEAGGAARGSAARASTRAIAPAGEVRVMGCLFQSHC